MVSTKLNLMMAYIRQQLLIKMAKSNICIDPTTAAVPVPKQGTKEINMSQAIAAVSQDRCKNITSVEHYNGAYKVECLDANSQQVEVLVDAVNGKISQISYDD